MGIILGALAGAADNVNKGIDEQMQSDLAMQRMQQQSQLDLQRAQAMDQFKVQLQNQQRQAMVDRVGQAKDGILQQAMAGNANKFYGDDQNLTADDLSDEEKAAFAPSARQQGDAYTQAAIQTGDIDPKDAANLGYKSDALMYKALYEQQREDGRNQRADDRLANQSDMMDRRLAAQAAQSDKRIAVMLAHYGNQGQGNPTKEALQFLDGSRKEISEKSQSLRALYKTELDTAKTSEIPAIRQKYQPQLDALDRQRATLSTDFNNMRTRLGLPAVSDATAPTPAPAATPTGNPAASSPAGPSTPAGKVLTFDPSSGTFK